MIKLNLQLTDIDYKTLSNLTGLGGLKRAAFKLLMAGAEAFAGSDKLNQLAVRAINSGNIHVSRVLTEMLSARDINVSVRDIRAFEISGSGSRIAIDAFVEYDLNSLFASSLPRIQTTLEGSERLGFLSKLLIGNPHAAKAAVAALVENLDKNDNEQLVAGFVNSYYDILTDALSGILADKGVRLKISSLSATVSDSLLHDEPENIGALV